MKIKHFNFFLILILSFNNLNAQEFKLGKVSIAELEQKQHPKDTAAVAAILFKKGETRFEYSEGDGFKVITEVRTRIKIYKKEGYDWANQEIHFMAGNTSIKETASFTDAVTYNLVNGIIEKTKLKSEGEFLDKINRYWSKRKITLPNVKEGSIIEFRYVIRTNALGILREFNFQTSIPIDYSEYKTFIPEYFVYKAKIKGFIAPKIEVYKSNNSFIINSKERARWSNTNFSTDKIDYQETATTYSSTDMPAIKEEAFVNNIENYVSSLEQELSATHYPYSRLQPYSTDWESVVKTIHNNDDFGPELNKTGYFEADLNPVVAGLTSQNEITLAVLNYVKRTVRWNSANGYSCDDGVKKAYKEKTGNVAEINLMLTAMLRSAGLTANPVLLSTRANGISIFPNHSAFNYVIAAVETTEGIILLDATSKFSTPNVLPFRDLNWIGRLIRKDGTSQEVDLMPKRPKRPSSDHVTITYKIDVSGKIDGTLRRQRTDHSAMIFRSQIANFNKEEYLEKLENENQKIEIKNYSLTNENDIQLPIIETFSFSATNLCERIGEKIYINPLLFFTTEQNPFKQDTREYPVDYGFPFVDKYIINIEIPEGYEVETLPQSIQISMEKDLGSFKFVSNESGNKIKFSVSHQINTPIVSSVYYPVLKDYYQAMIEKEIEKIVLKKV